MVLVLLSPGGHGEMLVRIRKEAVTPSSARALRETSPAASVWDVSASSDKHGTFCFKPGRHSCLPYVHLHVHGVSTRFDVETGRMLRHLV